MRCGDVDVESAGECRDRAGEGCAALMPAGTGVGCCECGRNRGLGGTCAGAGGTSAARALDPGASWCCSCGAGAELCELCGGAAESVIGTSAGGPATRDGASGGAEGEGRTGVGVRASCDCECPLPLPNMVL
jgi:hypothetical protein